MDEVRNDNAAIGGEPLGTISGPETEMVVDEGPSEAYGEPVMEERAQAVMHERRLEAPTPSKRNIAIGQLHNGYVVEVDCHKFAFETVDRMMKYVGEYLKDPIGTEKKWWDKELF